VHFVMPSRRWARRLRSHRPRGRVAAAAAVVGRFWRLLVTGGLVRALAAFRASALGRSARDGAARPVTGAWLRALLQHVPTAAAASYARRGHTNSTL
jgi:hypothetical protein